MRPVRAYTAYLLNKKCFMLCGILVLFSLQAFAGIVDIDEQVDAVSLANRICYLEDKDGRITYDQLTNPEKTYKWIKISLII